MKTWIIAEAGINHNGELGKAKHLAFAAKEAGANFVKFQTYFGLEPKYEFTKPQWLELFEYCRSIGIRWFSTPFDYAAIDFLSEQGMIIWKVSSGKAVSWEFLKYVSQQETNRVTLISSGMCNQKELIQAYNIFKKGPREVCVLQCTTAYPTPYDEVNLDVLNTWKGLWEYGLSDHTPTIETAIAAVALGASVIEKHLTLDRDMEGPDHQASLEPQEFAGMVSAIRNVELAMGNGEKKPTPPELLIMNEIREKMK